MTQAQGLTGQAAAKAQDVGAAAQEKASELREQGSARLRRQFDERSTQAGSQVRSVAEALRRSGSDLDNEGNTNAAQLTGPAADRIDRIGSYLEQKSGDELMRDIETFARRRPWMLAGLGLLAGMAAARFMKASSEQRYSGSGRRDERSSSPRATYGRAQLGGYAEPEPAGAYVTSAPSDDPLTRDPSGTG